MFEKKQNIIKALDNCFNIVWDAWKNEDNEDVKKILFITMEKMTQLINKTEDDLTDLIVKGGE